MAALALALPSIPGASCPSAAAALAAAGLGPVCRLASGAASIAGSAASTVVGFGAGSVLDAVAGWVSSGAVWLLGQIGGVLAATTKVDIGATWFTSHYRTMAALAGLVIVPLLLAGVIQAIHRQSATMLLRSVLINVPLAVLLTAVAVQLVELGLVLTDSMSSAVAQGSGVDTGHLFTSMIGVLASPAVGSDPVVPTFIVLLGSLAVVIGAFLLWVELLIREAAVYVAVLFLPLALASLAWPAISHWCRRLVDTLVALILGKFVIVSILSLAVGAMASGAGTGPPGSTGHGFSDLLGGAALLVLAAASPWTLLRLLPMVEAGAVGHLEGAGRRAYQSAVGPVRSLADTAIRLTGAAGGGEVGLALAAGSGGGAGTDGGTGGSGGSGAGPSGTLGGGGGGSPPDLGPSSTDRTGVGSVSPPGGNIPAFRTTPGAGEAYEASLRQDGYAPDGSRLPGTAGSPPPQEPPGRGGG
jgi:hypothetical protein